MTVFSRGWTARLYALLTIDGCGSFGAETLVAKYCAAVVPRRESVMQQRDSQIMETEGGMEV